MDFSMFENLHNMSDINTDSDTSKIRNYQNMPVMSRFPEKTPLAMAYVPVQQWKETYNIEEGFCRGTIFPELDLPFAPEEGCL